jgi:inosine-uridine nucleoside N-ribohydrolase
MNLRRTAKIVLVLLVVNPLVCKAEPAKVIIDTDFNTIGDDGQVGAMAAQLDAQGVIDLLGFTIPSGNQWRDQEVSDCLKTVERMGIENRVKVYLGSQYPLLHDYKGYLYEEQLFGKAIDYVGAYSSPQPDPNHLVPPPDGFATNARPAKEDAVDFIIQSIHRYPNQVSILAIGPLTNIAIAVRKDPSIIPLIKQIVLMGGQVYAAGNAYNDAGEFNWWFDPEAAQVVLRAEVPKFIVPLDCTNTVPLTKETYLEIADHQPSTPSRLDSWCIPRSPQMCGIFGSTSTPPTRAPTRHLDRTTERRSRIPQILILRSVYYRNRKVVFAIDHAAFLRFYVDLLTRAVPVKFEGGRHDQN